MEIRKRIGNDYTFTWAFNQEVPDSDPVPYDLTGRHFKIFMVGQLEEIEIPEEEITIGGADNNELTWTFYGKDQRYPGIYNAKLEENKGEIGMVTVDVKYAVTLVPHTWQETEDPDDEGGCISLQSVELETLVSMTPGPRGPQGPAGPAGVTSVEVSVDNNTGTPEAVATLLNGLLSLVFKNLKGATGATGQAGPQGPAGPAGVTSVEASVDDNTGTPEVEASLSNGVLTLTFKNLKGATGTTGQTGQTGPQGPTGPAGPAGVTSVEASVDGNTGTPEVVASLVNGLLSLAFKNLKGETGETGQTGQTGPQGPTGPAGPAGVTSVEASVDGNTGTPSVEASLVNGLLSLVFKNLKGETGATGQTGQTGQTGPQGPTGPAGPAGVTSVEASVDGNTGTPSVDVSLLNGLLSLAFKNLKGETGATGQTGQTGPQGPTGPAGPAGVTSAAATVDSNVGTPGVSVSLSNGALTFTFTNLKGETGATGQTGQTGPQGDPGDSCAVPVETAIPSGGLAANKHYALGTLTGSVVVTLDTTTEVTGQMNIYSMAFTAGSTAPTITWPGSITQWAGNCLDATTLAPVITGGNSYEVSIVDGLAVITEFVAA